MTYTNSLNLLGGMLMMEATWLLKSTDYNIKEIADELNFADQGSFSKYFKRLKGISPKNCRK
ncbi:MAG: helix-turn-helix domain-containing protein [Muribaculaceae bacterium]|nr:helix-turn-helix domain-containing protein [Muribaculaceae bacterium]